FDQFGSRTTFRTNAMPTMTTLGTGQAIIAWAERGFAKNGPNGAVSQDSRIVYSMSSDGGVTWSTRRAVDDAPTRAVGAHQAFPAIGFAAGKLTVSFMDFRGDQCLTP